MSAIYYIFLGEPKPNFTQRVTALKVFMQSWKIK